MLYVQWQELEYDLLMVFLFKIDEGMLLEYPHPLGGHLEACNNFKKLRDHWLGMEAETSASHSICQSPICLFRRWEWIL